MSVRFADADAAVVALGTVARIDALVSKRCWPEGRRIMAYNAFLGRRQMARWFTGGDKTVMAGCAVIDDADVIKVARCKCSRCMAGAAVLAGWHVIDRFTHRGNTVTGRTAIDDSAMIEHGPGKTFRVVTNPAVLAGRNMGIAHTDRIDAVIAGMAVCTGL